MWSLSMVTPQARKATGECYHDCHDDDDYDDNDDDIDDDNSE